MGRPKGSKNGVRCFINKQCEICLRDFQTELHRRQARFCSRLCKDAGHSKDLLRQQERKCLECSDSFTAKPSDKKIYCSQNCARQAHGKKVSGRRPFTLMATKTCQICNEQFTVRKSLGQKFCSLRCANKSFERRITLVCQVCSITYTVRARCHKQKYCGRTCRTVGIGKTESYLERRFADALSSAGIAAQKQFPIGTYTADFAIPESKIVIECDGDYWHSLPDCIKRDKRKDKFLLNNNWRVLRFPEHLINKDINSCVMTVKQMLHS